MSALLALEAVRFRYRGAATDALADVSLAVRRHHSVGLVGESGSGKTTALSLLLGLARPAAGRVSFDGVPLDPRDRRQMRAFRRQVQVVFQDPYSSLDPRQRVDRTVAEPLVSLGLRRGDRRAAVAEALAAVDLDADAARRYPHEFSGGQRQRIAIARALVTEPAVLLADEPVSALDVGTRLGIMALFDRLQRERGLTVVMVSHDLSAVAALCERVVVLKDGRVVEEGATRRVLEEPAAPYTRRLVAAVPRLPPQR
ncbi:ABC transporter ATP-binding protein [Georgenia thermotolerans]|uniref:ATP-binding cassette domain-containing protein n=1 Tax=Georgenia thermotolerans TaxID=527326 RepID=A0A7J5UM97_9MICO|nr:ABC transporter ATP-binding protein [Georgenia thermotolerans]KAE8763482.1 ATP-binding cassette domain-containing protein [Georgenia thermotolerans]